MIGCVSVIVSSGTVNRTETLRVGDPTDEVLGVAHEDDTRVKDEKDLGVLKRRNVRVGVLIQNV